MATANDIGRMVHGMAEHSKNVLAQNIVKAVTDGTLKGVDATKDLPTLLAIVNSSVDQSYHQSGRALDKLLANFDPTPAKKNI